MEDIMLTEEEIKTIKAAERQQSEMLHGIDRSLAKEIDAWRKFITEVANGYELTIYDYTNDLNIRKTIQVYLDMFPTELRDKVCIVITPIDEEFRSLTDDTDKTLMGDSADAYKALPWWYHRTPKRLVGELKDDIEKLQSI